MRIPSLIAVFTVLVNHQMIATYMFSHFGIQWHIPVRVEQEEILTYLYWSLTTKEKTEGVSFSGDGVSVLQALHHINWRFYDHYIATLQSWCPDHQLVITEVSEKLFDFMIITAQITLLTTQRLNAEFLFKWYLFVSVCLSYYSFQDFNCEYWRILHPI